MLTTPGLGPEETLVSLVGWLPVAQALRLGCFPEHLSLALLPRLWFCQLGVPSCRYLSDALLQNKSLTHLNLRKNHLGDEGIRLLCGALSRPDCSLQNLE